MEYDNEYTYRILVYFSDVVECTPLLQKYAPKKLWVPISYDYDMFFKILLSSVQNLLFSNDKFIII